MLDVGVDGVAGLSGGSQVLLVAVEFAPQVSGAPTSFSSHTCHYFYQCSTCKALFWTNQNRLLCAGGGPCGRELGRRDLAHAAVPRVGHENRSGRGAGHRVREDPRSGGGASVADGGGT